jgi:hypothetical protein
LEGAFDFLAAAGATTGVSATTGFLAAGMLFAFT